MLPGNAGGRVQEAVTSLYQHLSSVNADTCTFASVSVHHRKVTMKPVAKAIGKMVKA
jgi:hypothetical protein